MINVWHKTDLSPKFSAFAYQLNAVNSVKDIPYAGLFHEQGLGKTKIALDLALYWLSQGIIDSAFVVTKKGLVRNWKEEIEAHTSLFCAQIDGNKLKNSKILNRPHQLYLSHYEAVASNLNILSLFVQSRRVGIILDEAHHMKNPSGRVAKALFALSKNLNRRVVMTGTPVANRPYDIWSPVFFLDQGKALGDDFESFKAEYDLPSDINNSDSESYKNEEYERSLEDIFQKIKPFVVRETKQTAGIELPDKHLSDRILRMEAEQQTIYDDFKNKLRVKILKDGRLRFDDIENILKQMLRLIQIASNPMLVDQRYQNKPCKFIALESIVDQLAEGKKAIIWTNFVENADWLAQQLSTYGTVKIHGKLDMASRHRSIQSFKSDARKKLLIATPGAAKEGLTLTIANVAIFYDRGFSLNDWLQAQDRIHRISQEQECEIIHLMAENSIDQWIDRLLAYKNRCAMFAQGDLQSQNELTNTDEMKTFIEGVLS